MYIWTLYMLLYIYKISIAIIKNSTQTYTPKLYKSKWNSEKRLLYDSTHTTFLKLQNYRDGKQIGDCQMLVMIK